MPTLAVGLKNLGIAVDELLYRRPRVRRRFQQMILACEKAVKPGGKEQGVVLLPSKARSLRQKYSWLAAIHDVVCKDAKPIDPYDRVSREKTGVPLQTAMYYTVRMRSVRNLEAEDDVPYLVQALAVIVRDLVSHGLLPDEGGGISPRAPSGDGKMKPSKGSKIPRKTPLTEREKEVLKTYSDCGRDAAEAGRQLGTSKQYVSSVVKKSHQKLKPDCGSRGSVGLKQKLPANRDGVESVSEGRGASDKGTGRKLRVKQKF